jgi:CRP-like cAMP-binding protein
MAQKCTFPPGFRLMQEGSPAHHVIVIIKGRVRISAWRDGADQTITERGPGQLIGETAVLSVSPRSATVIALEEVHALVVTIEDFEAFITDHPMAHGIANGQVHERLDEGQQRRLQLLSGQNCTIVRTDVTAFSGHTRSAEHRRLIRQANLRMTQLSLQSIEESYSWEDRGDGLLIVVRPDIPTLTVLESLLTGLPPELKRHNHMYADAARIQLRIAIDVGPVVSDSAGISSDSIILASRLVDAHELKAAIRSRDADLGVIASEFVYGAAIRDDNALVDPTRYVRVEVNVKETNTYAWMKIIDLASPTRCPVDQGPTGVLPDVPRRPRAARLRHGHEHCYRRAHPHHATARPRRLRAG